MRFANPEVLHLIWLLMALAALLVFWERRQRGRLKKALGTFGFEKLTASVSVPKRRVKLICQLLALLFFALAWARPQGVGQGEEVKSLGIEILLLVDVSNSMLAEDIKPTRIDLAKRELKRLVDQMGTDRIALVAFAGSAILLSPLTTDKSAIKMYLDDLSPDFVQTQGTSFEKGLSEAMEAFQRGGVDAMPEEGRITKVVIITSDGEDHEQGALDLVEKLTGDGVRVFTLAVGTEAGDRIPIKEPTGYLRGYIKDASGSDVISRVNGTFLKELAQKGRGSFYHLSYGGGEITQLHSDLRSLEQAEFDSHISANVTEHFQIFLFLGFLFALIDLLLHDRKPGSSSWAGRFERAS